MRVSCKDYVAEQKNLLKEKISNLEKKPGLTVIQIGDNPSSNSYIRGKEKDCLEVGINFNLIKLEETVEMNYLSELILNLNKDSSVHGIILQLPVPKHIDVEIIQNLISAYKDVDGFHKLSLYNPCTPQGVINYLKYLDYDFVGKNACVIGRSDIVGRPLAKMLLDLDCTVTVCHSKTMNIEDILCYQDIVFTCINQIEYFNECFYDGQDIIDIGLGVGKDGKLHGNLDGNYAKKLCESNPDNILISGIGGTGLLTRLELLNNTYKAYLELEN